MIFLEKRLKYKRIFNKNTNLPKTEEEFKDWFDTIRAELSPENLHCDGEASPAQVKNKLKELKAEWAELEKLYGKSVPMDY